MTGFVSAYAVQVDDGKYPGLDATIKTHLPTIEYLLHESEVAGVNAEIPKLFKALVKRATSAGRGGDSYAAMIEQFRKAPA